MMPLAESLMPPAGFLTFLACGLFILGAYALILRIAVDRKKLGEKPAQPSKTPQPLEIMPAKQYLEVNVFESRFSELTERVGKFISADLFHRQCDEINGRLGGLEKQLSKQVADTEKYTHDMRHEFRNELQNLRLSGEDRGEQIHEQIAALNKANEERMVKVHDRVNDVLRAVSKLEGAFHESRKA